MFTILRSAGLSENLKINEAERHEAQGEARHEAREKHEQHDDQYVNEEGRWAACVLHRHYVFLTVFWFVKCGKQ